MFSFLLSQTNTSEVTHRNGYSLPSFFLPCGLVSWGAACREAVGSKDRNNILWSAVSYRVKTTPSSRQLDPLWPSSNSPKRGLSLELQVTAASLPAPLWDLVCVSYVSPPIPRWPQTHLQLPASPVSPPRFLSRRLQQKLSPGQPYSLSALWGKVI